MATVESSLIRGHLQNLSLKYQNQQFIWNEIAPAIDLPTRNSKITIYNRGDQFRDEAVLRARGDVTPWATQETSTVNVDTYQYSHKGTVTKEDLSDLGNGVLSPPIDMKQDVIEKNMDKINLKIERLVGAAVTAATWEDGTAGGSDADAKWVSTSGNTFLTDVDAGMEALRKAGIDLSSTRLMMDFLTWQGVRKNSDIASRTQYTRDKYPNLDDMAKYLGLDKIVVGGGIYSTAEKLADGSDFTAANIWGGSNDKGFAMLYHYPKRITRKTMAAAVTPFHMMDNGQRLANYEWYEKGAHSWFYETQAEVGVKQVCSDAAYAWKDTHTT